MATYSASNAKTITMVNGQVDTLTLTSPGKSIAFAITSGHTPIYFTAGNPGQTIPAPTVEGDNCYVVDYQSVFTGPWNGGAVTLKMIAQGTPTVTVMIY